MISNTDLANLIAIIGFYKTVKKVQEAYDMDRISERKAKTMFKIIRRMYIFKFGEMKDWLILR